MNQFTKTLVLNSDYQAIGVCSVNRAFSLVLLDKAQVVENTDRRKLYSSKEEFDCPSIIRLMHWVQIPFRRVPLSRLNIYRRDNFTCQYCGKKDSSKSPLTLDHVIPKSKGGQESWSNLVAACQKCNTEKGNMMLEDTPFKLLNTPCRPSWVMFLKKLNGEIEHSWKPFLYLA